MKWASELLNETSRYYRHKKRLKTVPCAVQNGCCYIAVVVYRIVVSHHDSSQHRTDSFGVRARERACEWGLLGSSPPR